jgi:tetratricopeptide (TPR) repeat protein
VQSVGELTALLLPFLPPAAALSAERILRVSRVSAARVVRANTPPITLAASRQKAVPATKRMRLGVLTALLLLEIAVATGFWLHERAKAPHPARTTAALHLVPRPDDWRFPAAMYLRTIPAHFSAVRDVAFTPDGERLLTASFDGAVKIWDVRTGQPRRALPGHTGRVVGVHVTPDGRYAVTADQTAVHVWSLPDGRQVHATTVGSGGTVRSLGVSPSGDTIVTGHADGEVKVWGRDGGAVTSLHHGHGRVLSVAFAPDGARLVTAGDDGRIKVWDVADWKLLRMMSDPPLVEVPTSPNTFRSGTPSAIGAAVVAPDGQILASASDDGGVRLWHIESGRLLTTLHLHTDEVWTVAFSPDGGTLVSGGKDAVLGIWSLPTSTLKEKRQLDAGRKVLGLAFTTDGSTFAATYASGAVDLWQLSGGGGHATIPEPSIVERATLSAVTPEERAYGEAMDLVDGSECASAAYDEAEAALQEILKTNPRSALAYAGLGRVAFRRGFLGTDRYTPDSLQRALDFASQAIAIDPALPEAYSVRGWAEHARKDGPRAHAAVAMALKLAPTLPRALMLSAELAIDDGDLPGAERALRTMLSRPVSRGLAGAGLETLSTVFEKAGDYNAADAALKRLVQLDPQSASSKSKFAYFLLGKGDRDGAVAMATQALAQQDYGPARRTLADAYCSKGEQLLWERSDPDGAAREFQEAVATDPHHARAAYELGAYHQYVGETQKNSTQLDEAKTMYSRALDLDSKNELARKALSGLGR